MVLGSNFNTKMNEGDKEEDGMFLMRMKLKEMRMGPSS